MSLVWELLSNPGAPLALREAGLERAHSDPGIPRREGSTASFWLKDPHPTVATARSQTWPEETEFAIVGSGIAGLSVAHALLTAGRDKPHTAPRVVVLEARDACSGATGRNGGHVIETGVDYLDLKHAFGQDAATQIVRFRLSHLPALLAVAASVPGLRERSQLRQVEFVTAYYDQTAYEHALASLAEFKADMPAESREFRSHSQDVLKEKFHLSDYAVGAISGPAGAAWPYRFVSGLWAALLQDHASLQLETNTPVSEIQLDAHGQYTLHTPRGVLRARHVVHCTNGHAGHLLPGLRGRLVPLRGQMSAQPPGTQFPHQAARSWLLYHPGGGLDYLTQLPLDHPSISSTSSSISGGGGGSNGEMMLGGGLASTQGRGLEELGVAQDDGLRMGAEVHLGGVLRAAFARESWGLPAGGGEDAVEAMWTGIMGFTTDGFPWVGKVPERLSGRERARDASSGGRGTGGAEWVAAGFSGEGMVHAWRCGEALAVMMRVRAGLADARASDELANWLPEQFRITEERIRASVLPLRVEDMEAARTRNSTNNE